MTLPSVINLTKDMQRSVILVTRSTALSSASLLISPWYMFLDKEEADNNRYESAELMIAANMPASTTPANKEIKNSVDISINMFSDELCVKNASG